MSEFRNVNPETEPNLYMEMWSARCRIAEYAQKHRLLNTERLFSQCCLYQVKGTLNETSLRYCFSIEDVEIYYTTCVSMIGLEVSQTELLIIGPMFQSRTQIEGPINFDSLAELIERRIAGACEKLLNQRKKEGC